MRRVLLTDTHTKEITRLDFSDSMTIYQVLPAVRSALIEAFNPHLCALHTIAAEHGPAALQGDIYSPGEDGSPALYDKARARKPLVCTVAMTMRGFNGAEKRLLMEQFPVAEDDDLTFVKIGPAVALFTLGTKDAAGQQIAVEEQAAAPKATPAPAPAAKPAAPKEAAAKPSQPPRSARQPVPEPAPEQETAAEEVEENGEDGSEGPAEDVYVQATGEAPVDPPGEPATDETTDYDPAALAAMTQANRVRSRRFGG